MRKRMYRVRQPAETLDFRFCAQTPKIPLHILHLDAPSSGRKGKCAVRRPPRASRETFQDAGPSISRVSMNLDHCLSIHTPGQMLVTSFPAFHSVDAYEFHWATVVSSHLTPQSQCTQTPKLSTNSSYLHPTSPGKACHRQ